MKNNSRITPKERGLIKGSLRRVFSRSELRRQALARNRVEHSDPKRPRVTAWVWCAACGEIFPRYTAVVDHISPLVPVTKTIHDMDANELVDRLWCELSNLQVLDLQCHKQKTKVEKAQRKKENKK